MTAGVNRGNLEIRYVNTDGTITERSPVTAAGAVGPLINVGDR